MLDRKYAFLAALSFFAVSSSAAVYYVSDAGDDANPGLSPDQPFLTLHHAVLAANQNPLAEEVVIRGRFAISSTLEVTGPYRLRGAEDDPEKTVISASGTVTPLVKLSDASAIISSLTLEGGTSSATSGGNLHLAGATAENCIIRNAMGGNGTMGTGVYSDNGSILGCVITNNSNGNGTAMGVGVYQTGGGARTLNSKITGNRSDGYNPKGGGGIMSLGGVVANCIVSNNVIRNELGHGAYGGGMFLENTYVTNCLVYGNKAGQGGGGVWAGKFSVIDHSTIVGNHARENTGGVSLNGGAMLSNCIVMQNTTTIGDAPDRFDISANGAGTIANILSPVEIGQNHIGGDAAFVDAATGDLRLSAASCAIGRASDGTDLGFIPFGEDFSVGMETLDAVLPEGERTIRAQARNAVGDVLFRWLLSNSLNPNPPVWTSPSSEPVYSAVFAPGNYTITVEAESSAGQTATFQRRFVVAPRTVYLSDPAKAGNTPAPPYSTPQTAASDIHDAIRYCGAGTRLVAGEGDYALTNELAVRFPVSIESLSGPGKTSIYRKGAYGKGDSFRLVALYAPGSSISGFALTNAYLASDSLLKFGANLYAYESIVTNCLIAKAKFPKSQFGTAALAAVRSKVRNCRICENEGGGGYGSGVNISGEGAEITDSIVENHYNPDNYYTSGCGIRANKAVIDRCVIRNNHNRFSGSGGAGGGVFLENGASILNSLVVGNKSGANGGGGIYVSGAGTRIVNCLVANNESKSHSGGLYVNGNAKITVINTIFYGNDSIAPSASAGEPSWNNLDNGSEVKNCAFPSLGALLGSNPVLLGADNHGFSSPQEGDFSLALNSPCRDSGFNYTWTADDKDIAGNPRIAGDAVDIGPYELQPSSALSVSVDISGFETADGRISFAISADGENTTGLEYRVKTTNLISSGEQWSGWSPVENAGIDLPPGKYSFDFEIRNEAGEVARPDGSFICNVVSKTVYLEKSSSSSNPLYPYSTPESAATNIFDALSAAGNGTTVFVKMGDYGIKEPVEITRSIRVEAIEGPGKTSIYRDYPRVGSYPSFRLVRMENPGAVLSGFAVSNCVVQGGSIYGAAIYNRFGTVTNCIVKYNKLVDHELGGAVANIDGLVVDTVISDNSGGAEGMGLYQSGASAVSHRLVVCNNSNPSYYACGGVYLMGGLLSSSVITGNVTQLKNGGFAGGVEMKGGVLKNCLVAKNRGGSGAGGVRAMVGSIIGCTVAFNESHGNSNTRAGGILLNGENIAVTNTIVWGNKDMIAQSDGEDASRSHDIILPSNFSNAYLSHVAAGNFDHAVGMADNLFVQDPLFSSPADNLYALGKHSPYRLCGKALAGMENEVDASGAPRLGHRGRVDMGSFQMLYIPPPTIFYLR